MADLVWDMEAERRVSVGSGERRALHYLVTWLRLRAAHYRPPSPIARAFTRS